MEKFHYKSPVIRGYERPDGTPNDPKVKKFIKSVTQDGGLIMTLDGTNRMFLVTVESDLGYTFPRFVSEILPGDFVMVDNERAGAIWVTPGTTVDEDYTLVED